ncbi:hypothetical protein WR25_00910 [Diploscapter pachys]|uniref:EGF-like domain-containing protein n=1 Tax=Diploscapter pachys TaxID=2018661 RepID=A0A2A2KVP8_9BILA|nr:hypothetical protein WR25_00910 [Diploscapter pachys]
MEIFSPFMDKDFFDEAIGMPYECAMKSFCPDVCCRSVSEILRSVKPFTALCRMNPCKAQEWERCTLEPNKNNDLFAIRKNNWNATCPCDSKAEIFRADIQRCVAHNPCYKKNLCEVNEKCVNVYGGKGINDGYLCICQLGYIKTDTGCEPISLSLKAWHGLAHSEPTVLQEDSEARIHSVILLAMTYLLTS